MRAELLKTLRRPAAGFVLALFIAAVGLLHFQSISSADEEYTSLKRARETLAGSTLSERDEQALVEFIQESQSRLGEAYYLLRPQGSFVVVLGFLASGPGAGLAILVGAVGLGQEYAHRTLAPLLARNYAPVRFVAHKIAAGILLMTVTALFMLVAVTVLDIVLSGRVPPATSLARHGISGLVLLPRASLNVAFWLTVGVTASIVGRSTVAGLAGGFGYLMADAYLGQTYVWARAGSVTRWIAALYPAESRAAYGTVTSALWFEGWPRGAIPDARWAAAGIAAVGIVILCAGFILFKRREVAI